MPDNSWMKDLKVGDRVVTKFQGFGKPRYEITTVKRTTATQILCGHGRFRKSDGMSIGSTGWNRTWLFRPATADDESNEQEQILRSRFTDKLNAVDWKQLTTDQLRRIVDIFDEVTRTA